jgi:PTS system nitrogen regulatory IIA component
MIGDLLAPGAICPRVTATDKRQVLSVVSEVAARVHRLKAGAVFDALLQREAAGSTGVGHGVAIPHALVPGLERIHGIFVRLKPPIDYLAVDNEPVDLVFALLAPPSDAADHLRSLARTARVLRSADLRRQLRLAHGTDALRALLSREARPNAA